LPLGRVRGELAVVALVALEAFVAFVAVSALLAEGTLPSVLALTLAPVSEPGFTFPSVTIPVARVGFG
jgi:hypothetical protein